MKVSELFALVAERGLLVELDEAGAPRLRGRVENATPALLKVLKKRREEIIRHLGAPPAAEPSAAFEPGPPLAHPREWLWATGNYYREAGWVAAMPQYEGRHPWGAAWWRHQGEAQWQALPDVGEANIANALALAKQKGHPI